MMSHSDIIDRLITDRAGRVFSLFVRQPFASAIARKDEHIEIRNTRTALRGDMLICSTQKHDFPNAQGGCTIAMAELYDVKPVHELTEKEWGLTRIQKSRRSDIQKGFAWLFRDIRRIIEYPAKSKNKIAYIKFNLDDIFIYPKYVIFDKEVGIDKVRRYLERDDGS